MKYQDFVKVFEDAANAYVPTPPNNNLSFHYDYVWYNNGAAANDYPSMLFECSPDFDFKGISHTGRTGRQRFQGKLFFYDTFWESEKAVKKAYEKQSELNELANQILVKVYNDLLAKGVSIQWGKGFMGKDVHNPRLVQVFVPFTAEIPQDCTVLPT